MQPFLKHNLRLSDGVTGNTSPFGGEESWFEPRSDNFQETKKPVKSIDYGLSYLNRSRIQSRIPCNPFQLKAWEIGLKINIVKRPMIRYFIYICISLREQQIL